MVLGLGYGKRICQIVIKKYEDAIDVNGSGLWYSDILKRPLKKEWRSTNKRYFELPYNKIF
jgi:hypothetical protein